MKISTVLGLSVSLAGCVLGDQGVGDSDQGAAVGDKEEFIKGCSKRSFPTYSTEETNSDGRKINYTFISECDTQEAIYNLKQRKIDTDLCSAFAGGLSQVPALERIGGVTAYFCDLASVAGDLTILELERLSQKGGNCGIVRIDTFTPRVHFGVRWNYKHDVSWRPQVCPAGVSSLLGSPAPLVASPGGGGDPDDPSQLSYLGLPVAAPGEVDSTPVEVAGDDYLVASPIEAQAASCDPIAIPVRLDEGSVRGVWVSSVTRPNLGVARIEAAATIRYAPNAGGADTFSYVLRDPNFGLEVSNVVNVTSNCEWRSPEYEGRPIAPDETSGAFCENRTVFRGGVLFTYTASPPPARHTRTGAFDHWEYSYWRRPWNGSEFVFESRIIATCFLDRDGPPPN
jgi:hypothetical protein